MNYLFLMFAILVLAFSPAHASEKQKQDVLDFCQKNQDRWPMDCTCVIRQYDVEIGQMNAAGQQRLDMDQEKIDEKYRTLMAAPGMGPQSLERMCTIIKKKERVAENNRKFLDIRTPAAEKPAALIDRDPKLDEELRRLQHNLDRRTANAVVGYCGSLKIIDKREALIADDSKMLNGSTGMLNLSLGNHGHCQR
ncbi:MAG: hypothetical protein H6868_02870 [Rhodospirillales bacterium]|nr:hypothetical protein [Rhodospirillales bacterium]